MSEGEMSEQWVERIADAVVKKLDEHEQITAIARLVLQMLGQRQAADGAASQGSRSSAMRSPNGKSEGEREQT